ncbi:helix-turn-helix transcriptional regulator [Tropicimonas sp. S265A]|uniref:helix-turn-helix transcriptional regulator n=1 Tax=Tropicimonas sp. S265A TaxID=3415134 RepID=UPI003C7AE1B7
MAERPLSEFSRRFSDPPALPSGNELLSRTQVEKEFGLTRSFLQKCAWRGDGPAMVRLGYRTVRYRRADIVAFINEMREL